VAAETHDAYPDGVWFVELGSITDPALVPSSVAQVLGVRERSGFDLTETLAGHLKSRRLLLLLDNCEHLIHACASLATALLVGAPEIRIVASSREQLQIAGEQIYPVPPLSLPTPGGNLESPCALGSRPDVHRARPPAGSCVPADGAPGGGDHVHLQSSRRHSARRSSLRRRARIRCRSTRSTCGSRTASSC
jgi:predicted ATPase